LKLTIRNLFLIILFCGIFYLSLKPIVDPDFWWHLRTGQLIEQTRSIPKADPFSFTANSKQWTAHEWLSDLLIYGLYTVGGYGLLIMFYSTVITSSFIFPYLLCPQRSKPYIAGFAVLLGAITSAPIWGVRPQMFNMLFVSILFFLLDRYRQNGNIKALIPIPLVMILWVNLHAGFILGIGIELIFILGYLLEVAFKTYYKKEKIDRPSQKPLLFLIGVLIISIIAALFNPSGLKIMIYPFQTLTDSSMQKFISEWFSPDFHQLIWQPFALLILALIGAGMVGKRPISITRILLALVFGYGALRSIRNIPLFAIAAIPVLAEQFNALFEFKQEAPKPSRFFRFLAPVLLAGVVLVLTIGSTQMIKNQQESESKTFPLDAVNWIVENKPAGHIFNTYNWGGYLVWKLYPEYLVYIDGRADLYGKDFLSEYTEIYFSKPGWEEKLEQEKIGFVLVEKDSLLANALRQNSSWELTYEDKISVIFLRK
jgi:hypothetical protein